MKTSGLPGETSGGVRRYARAGSRAAQGLRDESFRRRSKARACLAGAEEKIDGLVAELEQVLANDIKMAAAADVRKGLSGQFEADGLIALLQCLQKS